MYDYLIVGAGLYGATFARLTTDAGKKVLVIDKRNAAGGNAYTEEIDGIQVHRYGAHIFHTSDHEVWSFVQRFADFNDYVHSLSACYKDRIYSLPFNMNTFSELWEVKCLEEAEAEIERQKSAAGFTGSMDGWEPVNLEEQALSTVGTEIYETLIKGYTEKQWGRSCAELPASIIKRIPIRYTYDNRYFGDQYQGIPLRGYTHMVNRMLDGIDVRLDTDYLSRRSELDSIAEKVVYTGPIDEYYDYRLGHLEYRTADFVTEKLDERDHQGKAVMNYTDKEIPWLRIVEHKWFTFGKDREGRDIDHTIITREYSREWKPGDEPYYPVNDDRNSRLYNEYRKLADREAGVIFGGRLGEYRYYDMDQVIAAAIAKCKDIMGEDLVI